MQPSAEGNDYWAIGTDAALERLGVTRLGLSKAEAERRLAVHGPNRLPVGRRRSALMRFARSVGVFPSSPGRAERRP